MPPLTAISVEGYRCFAERTKLTLAPLTLLYGWNNSGKSSLLRLLPMLTDSVAESVTLPLAPSGVFDPEVTLRDLVWKGGEVAEIVVELGFPEDQKLRRVRFTVGFESPTNRPVLREVVLTGPSDRVLLTATHKPASAKDWWETVQHYEVARPGKTKTAKQVVTTEALEFQGLVPAASAKPPWTQLRKQLLGLRDSVLWLRSQRGPLRRFFPDQGAIPRLLKPDGSDAEYVLRHHPDITQAVSKWYEHHVERRLKVQDAADRLFRLVLETTKRASWGVDLVDSGQGLQQVLPVLVALEMARRHSSGGPSIVAIEEADASLHDNAQRWLGEHLCQLASEPCPPAVILETHSQILMLAVQLAVASGTLPRERVQIYWVSTDEAGRGYAEPVTLSPQGEPEGRWPPAFADKLALSRELLRKKLGT
jgi:predicted ATPase